jgi:hypothetical protein
MSRSIKKTPVFGITSAKSEKQDKQRAHGAERAHARTALESASDLDGLMLTTRKEAHSNVYDFAKDGKYYRTVRVAHEGRALKVLSAPTKSIRKVHKLLGK